jgi:hypothetical protein
MERVSCYLASKTSVGGHPALQHTLM